MAIITQDYGSVGGGLENYIWVGIAHKTVDDSAIYTAIVTPLEDKGVATFNWDSTVEQSHSATTYGTIFDFTINVTTGLSIRFYRTSGTIGKYVLMDIIKNGSTIESGIQLEVSLNTNMTYSWSAYFGIKP